MYRVINEDLEVITQVLTECMICHASVFGNAREVPCSFCRGTGKYTAMGYKFYMHHVCDCMGAQCDICNKPCHHMRT